MENEEVKNPEIVEVGETKRSSMVYVILAIILLVAVGGGVYFMNKGSESKASPEEVKESTPRPSPVSLKGQNFTDSKFANSAVLIYPGTISKEAQAVMSGWNLKTKKLSDGTVQADLIPTESEAVEGDSRHSFNLKQGDKLYFADLNPGDDNPGSTDNNKNDDMGIVVDAQGVIQ